MDPLTLILGNKNYSSWSLRPWLALKQAGIPFAEVRIALYTPESKQQILTWSPSGKVPALRDGDLVIWDSLAICEYLAERHPDAGLWPARRASRAVARAVCAEMHAGFAELRSRMSMNLRRALPGKGMAPGVQQDIARITRIWEDCRGRYGGGGDLLFGTFTVADAFYAPVALRFQTYGVALGPVAQAYSDALLALPAVQQWVAQARAEQEVIPEFELYP